MSKDYSEASLIEQPAIELCAGLGWQTVGAFDEVFGTGGTQRANVHLKLDWGGKTLLVGTSQG